MCGGAVLWLSRISSPTNEIAVFLIRFLDRHPLPRESIKIKETKTPLTQPGTAASKITTPMGKDEEGKLATGLTWVPNEILPTACYNPRASPATLLHSPHQTNSTVMLNR
jgi:hypothetical protein